MFRQLCLVALAFLAVSDAKNTTKSIKDSKSCGSGFKKVKTTTFCTFVKTDAFIPPPPAPPAKDPQAILVGSAGELFDCDDVDTDPTKLDFVGLVGVRCSGTFNDVDPEKNPEVLCDATFTVNTEDVKSAKKDFSSLTATFWAFLDDIKVAASAGTAGKPLDLTDNIGTVVTGANGAWGKVDGVKEITFTRKQNKAKADYYEVEIEYKTRGFNPVGGN